MPANLKPLTALRFAAALWVVAYHYWPDLGLAEAQTPRLIAKGYLGVELFFVLSGFILCHVYLTPFGEGRFRYGPFLWARLARIYPLHLATLVGIGLMGGAALAAGFTISHPVLDWPSLPANLLLVQAWGLAPQAAWNHPSWSISAEWSAYLSFPAFAWVAWRLRARPNLAVALALVLLFALYAAYERATGQLLTRATIAWGPLRILPCFAYGCAVWLLWRSGVVRSRREAKLGAAAAAAALLASVLAGAPDAAIVAACGGLILALAGLTSTGSRLLSGPAGVYLGEISFAVYMVAIPWQLLFINLARKGLHVGSAGLPGPLWLVYFAGVIPVAALAHHLVERPARAAMRRLDWPRLRPTRDETPRNLT